MGTAFKRIRVPAGRSPASASEESLASIITGIAIRKLAFAIAAPALLKTSEKLTASASLRGAQFLKTKGEHPMKFLDSILQMVLSNMSLIIYSILGLIILNLILESYVAILAAKGHAPARRFRYSNSRTGELIELEASSLEIAQIRAIIDARGDGSKSLQKS